MSKRVGLLLVGAFTFFYILNYLMPLAFGDDYLYAFIWQGNPMYVPLTEGAVKVSSLHDLIMSQVSFYLTWSGRIVNNTLSQLFVWMGKDVFNICNALASVILVLELYWCANKGKVTLNIDISRLAWLFLFYWLFTPSFSSVVFWLVGACHYLWTAVFLTGFLIPYIRKYYCFENKYEKNHWFSFIMLVSGVIAGCTNENSVCWIILLLFVFVHSNRKSLSLESWMFTGLFGLNLGYALLMLSPGNFVRLQVTHDTDWFGIERLLGNMHVLAVVLVIQFLLWYFCLRSLPKIFKASHVSQEAKELHKELVLVVALCASAMGMTFIMLFSPEFHLRSAFPGTVQLIIITGIIMRIEKAYSIKLLQQNVKKFLTCVGVICFIVSAGFTLRHLYNRHNYNEKLLANVTALKEDEEALQFVLTIEPFSEPDKVENFLSCYHTFDNNLSKNVNSWMNVSFARYYGIKGICILDTLGKSASAKEK